MRGTASVRPPDTPHTPPQVLYWNRLPKRHENINALDFDPPAAAAVAAAIIRGGGGTGTFGD